MIKVVGIDPGLAATGVAVVNGAGLSVSSFSYGAITTKPCQKLQERLNSIYSGLVSVLEAEQPDLMVVEDVFSVEKFPKSGITLGKVTGIILLAGCRKNIPIMEVSVREAKQVLTGSGRAGKKQLEESVRRRLNHSRPIKPYHSSDAMALAMIGLFRWDNPLLIKQCP
ncbi:MAG: crossover junction endodeoxyribonuclease [Desulfobacteraceae bacterium]|nr:MAG: crossover junction endodeoxyribonuclease [Desulfobacteraceae bacterium]